MNNIILTHSQFRRYCKALEGFKVSKLYAGSSTGSRLSIELTCKFSPKVAHLFVYDASWRLTQNGQFLATSDDVLSIASIAHDSLIGLCGVTLDSLDTKPYSSDLRLSFSNLAEMDLFCVSFSEGSFDYHFQIEDYVITPQHGCLGKWLRKIEE